MKKILKLLVFSFVPFLLMGQEKDYYDIDNSYHEIFRNSKVKSLKVYTKEYEKGALKEEYLELVQNFDNKGNIIREREYFDSDSTKGWEVYYFYNENHQTIRTEWTWLDENDKDVTEYEYNSDNILIKSCDYYKSSNGAEYELEECLIFHYKKNRIHKVTTTDYDLHFYYMEKDGLIMGYTASNKLEYKYKNGEFIYQNLDSIIFHYKRNEIGQILEITKTDSQENIKNRSVYEYSNMLLKRIVSKENNGTIIREEDYIYEFYE